MLLIRQEDDDEITVSKFLDFDKNKRIFYNNIYLEKEKLVVKVPLTEEHRAKKDLKINRFDLTKYTFLMSYD